MAVANRFPEWLRRRVPISYYKGRLAELLSELKINTVCQAALCPNIGECFSGGVATFMILGDTCTRNCRYCNIKSGKPAPVDASEPERIAEAAKYMKLSHLVITSVTRDDLPDGGALHFYKTIMAIKSALPEATIEVLTPDFGGSKAALEQVLKAMPDVFNHNIEAVERIFIKVRPQGSYQRSLNILKLAKELTNNKIWTKSGFMLGLGETEIEVISTLQELKDVGCDVVTIGQYLQPSKQHFPVQEYIPPDKFLYYGSVAKQLGFYKVKAGPFVRSSYGAGDLFSH